MVTRYRIGNPPATEAVVKTVRITPGIPEGWKAEEEAQSLSFRMQEDTQVFGLGESIRGMNKRGWLYTSFCSDDPHHTEDKHALYAAQNFLVFQGGGEPSGLFVDAPGRVDFDIGYTDPDLLTISFRYFEADLYIIRERSAREIVKTFRRMIGRSYIPPRWAFGYCQSRWSYMTADEVRDVVRGYRDLDIPLEAVCLDIDYMERYKDFTVNKESFGDLAAFAKEMREEGIHLVPIIDAGVKAEEGYAVFEEGEEKGYFCKKEDGTSLEAAVWPGLSRFPDVLNSRARAWFGDQYRALLELGIDGFWNDMNEPAVFYTQDRLRKVLSAVRDLQDENMDLSRYNAFTDLVSGLQNNPEDYESFYHDMDGERVRHDRVHNLFGFNMTRAAGEAFRRLCPDQRILMYSRSSYIGMHRYGGVWTGDNMSWWSHMRLNLCQMSALNMCGFLYAGADTGGFGGDTTEDLLLRWHAMSIFFPLLRNHSAMGTRRQELYRFRRTDLFRSIIRLRYALLPYLYTEFMHAALEDDLYACPLAFEWPEDERACRTEDQLLIGRSLMIAPVMEQNARGRYVYLPEEMKLVRFASDRQWSEEILPAGDHYIPVPEGEVQVFLRKGCVLPLAVLPEKQVTVEEAMNAERTFISFGGDPESFVCAQDDGITPLPDPAA